MRAVQIRPWDRSAEGTRSGNDKMPDAARKEAKELFGRLRSLRQNIPVNVYRTIAGQIRAGSLEEAKRGISRIEREKTWNTQIRKL